MTLHEPATFATDVLLASVAAYLAWRLHRVSHSKNIDARWLSKALALTAVSAIVGGTYHGFAPNFSDALNAAWWRLTLLTIDLLSAAMAISLVYEVATPGSRRPLFILVAAKLFIFAIATMLHPVFWVAIADYGSTMLVWLAAAIFLNRPWRVWMLAALVLSGIAAAVQQFHQAPAPWFNHNDFYHLVQIAALFAFYQAGRRFGDWPGMTICEK